MPNLPEPAKVRPVNTSGSFSLPSARDKLLFTPGPLTTGKRVKEVMVHDWGSRDAAFLKINSEVLTRQIGRAHV